MKKFKFNEQSAIEKIIKDNFVDENNVTNTIYSIAKYNYHVLSMDDKDNYNAVLQYILDNCDNLFEESIYSDIENCIKSAKKHKLASIDEVCITESEINIIRELGDIKQEKAAFVLLAVSKYLNAIHNDSHSDSAYLTNAEICKLARITIPVSERDVFMQFAYDKELVYRHTFAGSVQKKLTFVSHEPDDKVVLRLNEADYLDLAYAYLAYLEPHKFKRCFRCKKWMRGKDKKNELCTDCKKNNSVKQKNVLKTIECIDCGKPAYVDIRNMTKIRCDECQHEADKEKTRLRVQRFRENNKKM